MGAFVLRLRELYYRWQERDEGEDEERDDLLLDQVTVGLRAGPIKQELSRQLRRNEQMTFQAMCKEARALEQELQDGEGTTLSQRVTAPASRHTTTTNLGELKEQIQAELQQGLIMEQMKALSTNLVEEVRSQLCTREAQSSPTSRCTEYQTLVTSGP